MNSTLILVAGFGMLGVFSRLGIQSFVQRITGQPSPWSTFAINLLGSFAIGMVFVLASEREMIPPAWRTGLMVGLLGGFTTFSAFSLDTIHFMEQGKWVSGLLYFVGSPLLGALMTFLAIAMTRRFF